MRMALYEFIVKYKPGKENLLADFLSRLNEETPEQDADEENDYHDQLVASIEVKDTKKPELDTEKDHQIIKEPWLRTELDKIEDQSIIKETLYVNVIAREPTSETPDEYINYCVEQDKDEDIIWIKNLILKHKEKKPVITRFENNTRRIFFKEYNNLRIIEDLVTEPQKIEKASWKRNSSYPNRLQAKS